MQKPSTFDANFKRDSLQNMVSEAIKIQSHHVPQLCDSKEYKSWNDKLARKMNYMHKLYKRFINRYSLKQPFMEDKELDPDFSGDIMKHLINYQEDCNIRFLHDDMKIMDPEILAIVQLFEDLEGQNPFKPTVNEGNDQNEMDVEDEADEKNNINYEQESNPNQNENGKFAVILMLYQFMSLKYRRR